MSKIHFAAIDIGSNAVRLLIKCFNGKEASEPLSKVQLVRVPLRLGEDAFTKGKIRKRKVRKLLSLMKAYKELMDIYDVVDYRACATSAMRDSSNQQEVVEEIYQKTGILIEVIDGTEEAELISDNRIDQLLGAGASTFLYCDVGGGSTEINVVQAGQLVESRSFDIGTVRQISGMVRPEERMALEDYLRDLHARFEHLEVVGSGGNINKLLRLGAPAERANINQLPSESLRKVVEELKRYSSQERMIRFRLKPDRADVIVPAGEIFLLVTDIVQAPYVIVPTKGLADGILDSIYQKHLAQGIAEEVDEQEEA